MRAVEVCLSASSGWFGPFHRATVDAEGISLEALHELRLLSDGSGVVLYEYTGDRAAAERIAADQFGDDGDWLVADQGARKFMYVHAVPSETVQATLVLLHDRPVVVDWPVRFVDDRTLSLTLVGEASEVQAVVDAVPEGVDIRPMRTGEYRPATDRLLADLTPRERETLRTAVELGYYRNPRAATYEDVAEAIDCTTSTVGHHLRNAETKVMEGLLAGGTGG